MTTLHHLVAAVHQGRVHDGPAQLVDGDVDAQRVEQRPEPLAQRPLAVGDVRVAHRAELRHGRGPLTTLSLRRAEDQITTDVDAAVATTDGYVRALQVGVVVLLAAAVVAAIGVRRGEGSTADPAAGTPVAA